MSFRLILFCAATWAAPVAKDVPAPDPGGKIVPIVSAPLVPTAGTLAAANLVPTAEIPSVPPTLPAAEAAVPRGAQPIAPNAAAVEAAASRDEGALPEPPAKSESPEPAPETRAAQAAERFDKAQRFRYAFTPSQRTPAPALRLNAASRNPNVLEYLRSKSFKDHLKEARRLAVETAGGAADYAIWARLRDVPKGEKINGHTTGHPIKKQNIRMTMGPEPESYDDTDVQSTFFHEHGHAVLNLFLHAQKSAGQAALDRAYELKVKKALDTGEGKEAIRQAKLYHSFADPSRETFADVFRILVMRAPGAHHRPRDFSKMEEDLGSFGGEKHLELNPFRAHLWNKWLKGRLGDAAYRARVLQVLARVCLDVPEKHFLAALSGGAQTEGGVEMNQDFIDAFDRAMSASPSI
ncbi:MAG: hypothetical protein HY077_16350 [Elusimicrobia bacterium]|nr:hypothetical protein [Elusimicrobiota bacterium]